jgi:hypothetical protein
MERGLSNKEVAVDKVLQNLLSLNAYYAQSGIEEAEKLLRKSKLPKHIKDEITVALIDLSTNLEKFTKDSMNDPELKQAIANFINAKGKNKENKAMDEVCSLLEEKTKNVINPFLGKLYDYGMKNEHVFDIYWSVALSVNPTEVGITTLTEYKHPSKDLEK